MHAVRWILYNFVLSGLLIFSQQLEGTSDPSSSIVRSLERNAEILSRTPDYFWNENKHGITTYADVHKEAEYQFSKYNGGNKSLTFKDLLRIVHPKPANEEKSCFRVAFSVYHIRYHKHKDRN